MLAYCGFGVRIVPLYPLACRKRRLQGRVRLSLGVTFAAIHLLHLNDTHLNSYSIPSWYSGNRTWASLDLLWNPPLFVAALVNKLVPWRAWLLSSALEVLRLWLRLRLDCEVRGSNPTKAEIWNKMSASCAPHALPLGDLGGTGGRPPKFEVGDGPCIRLPQYFEKQCCRMRAKVRTE